jgi:hypothetical protein
MGGTPLSPTPRAAPDLPSLWASIATPGTCAPEWTSAPNIRIDATQARTGVINQALRADGEWDDAGKTLTVFPVNRDGTKNPTLHSWPNLCWLGVVFSVAGAPSQIGVPARIDRVMTLQGGLRRFVLQAGLSPPPGAKNDRHRGPAIFPVTVFADTVFADNTQPL